MNKHEFNILPEASAEELAAIVADMRANGYDARQPIVTFEGAILDGWNRYVASQQAGVEPVSEEFAGDAEQAFLYTIRTNKRRNLTSFQWACVAVDAEPILARLRAEAKARQLAAQNNDAARAVRQKIDEQVKGRVDEQAAELFGTNRTYIAEAEKLKVAAPEVLAQAKAGTVTRSQAKKQWAPATKPKPAKAKAKPTPVPDPAPEEDDGRPTLEEIVDELQAENTRLIAEIKALEADDQKAETIKWHRLYEHAQRAQSEAMEAASRQQKEARRLGLQVRECCQILKLEDPRKLVAVVRKLANRVEAA